MVTSAKSHSFNMMMIVIMAILVITPLFSRTLHPALAFFAFVIWAADSMIKNGYSFLFGDKFGIGKWWTILIVWEIVLSIVGYSTTEPNTFIVRRLPVYLTPIIGCYCVRVYSAKELKTLFRLLFTIILINLFSNIVIWIVHPEIYEGITRFDAVQIRTNAGETGFVHDVLFLAPILYIIVKSDFSKGKKWFYFAIIALSVLYISVINSRATAFFILIFYVFAFFFVTRANRSHLHGFSRIVLYVVALALVIFFSVPILELLAGYLPERLVVRIESTINSINGRQIVEDNEGSLYARWMLSQVSLGTWLSNPIYFFIGKGEDLAASGRIDDLVALGIGQHSEFVDFLAKYGLLGAFLLFKSLKSTFNFILSIGDNTIIKSYVKIVMIGFLIMSVLNNTLIADNVIVIFVILPVVVFLVQNKMSAR